MKKKKNGEKTGHWLKNEQLNIVVAVWIEWKCAVEKLSMNKDENGYAKPLMWIVKAHFL